MGTWGTGSFDNDEACDWLFDLQRSHDLSQLARALKPPPGYLEASDASVAIAAAEVVAAGLDRPRPDLPDKVTSWIGKHPELCYSSLLSQTREQLTRLLSPNSELLELWEDSADLSDWKADVEGLLARLEFSGSHEKEKT